MTEPAQSARLGELVGGKYRIVRLLARGGMGVVYEAQHAVVKRRFAVKFLRPELASRRDILTRFQREAEAAGALESENVAAAVDFGVADDGAPYIVMEFLVGENLGALLEREKTLPIGRAADLIVQSCRGVQAAHAAGIVHRDLKPQNLFVCRREDGTDLVKVLDFGVAKLQALDELQAATRTGTVLGTAAYMSPEQARGDKEIDHRADVYALGAIAYELVSGKKPHPGDSHNAVLHHIATQPAVSLADALAGAPAPLVEIVDRAVASRPDGRPASAEALAGALAPLARREVWPEPKGEGAAVGPGALSSTMLAPGPAASTGRPPTSPTGSAAVRPAVDAGPRPRRLAGALAGLAVGGAILFALLRPSGAPPAEHASPAPSSPPTPAAPPAAERAAGTAPGPAPSTAAVAAPPAAAAPPTAPGPAPSAPASTPAASAAASQSGRPRGRSGGRPPGLTTGAATPAAPSPSSAPPAPAGTPPSSSPAPRPSAVTFDPQNPYN